MILKVPQWDLINGSKLLSLISTMYNTHPNFWVRNGGNKCILYMQICTTHSRFVSSVRQISTDYSQHNGHTPVVPSYTNWPRIKWRDFASFDEGVVVVFRGNLRRQ